MRLAKILFHCALIMLATVMAACGSSDNPEPTSTTAATLVPSLTPSPPASATAAITPTPLSAEITAEAETTPEVRILLEAAEGEELDPPINISLPEGWEQVNDALLFEDVVGMNMLPFTYYSGPVTGGDGFIIVLWGFGSLGGLTGEASLWADGLRLLRLAVLESGCNIGTDVQRSFTVGGQPAQGTRFSAVNCPETVDTRGWFAGLQQDGLNFVFYVYTEPIEAMDGPAASELQSILDSVEFYVQAWRESLPTLTPAPGVTPDGE